MPNNALDHASTKYGHRTSLRQPDRAEVGARHAAPSPAPAAQPDSARGTWHGLAGLLGLGVPLVVAAGALGVRAWQVGSELGSALFPVDDIVELAAVSVGAVVAGRVGLHALVALVWVLADRRGLRWAAGERAVARHAPAVVRRLTRAAAGAGIGLALAAPMAMALPERDAGAPDPADARPAVVLDLGWRPTDGTTNDHQAAAEGAPERPTASRPGPAPERSSLVNRGLRDGTERLPLVVVEPGDTLWALAAERLGAERSGTAPSSTAPSSTAPSDAEIAAAVTRWHHANQHVLGGNPDLIRPGTVLRQP